MLLCVVGYCIPIHLKHPPSQKQNLLTPESCLPVPSGVGVWTESYRGNLKKKCIAEISAF